MPGPVETRARFGWIPPARCSLYGIGHEAVQLTPFAFDFVNLGLVRSENLDDPDSGTDALYVWLQSETETGDEPEDLIADLPIVKLALISR